MTGGRLTALTADDLDAAAALLEKRHARHRAYLPMLADIHARNVVEHAWIEASGSLAARDSDGQVRGYLLWHLRETETWGRFVWVDRADHASDDPEVTRDLYARAAQAWVDDGIVKHAIVVPAVAEDLHPWERLGFARMQVSALQQLLGDDRPPDPRVRPAGPDEIETAVRPFAAVIWEHQAASPTFTGLTTPTWDELRADWLETLAEDGIIHLVAEEDGQAVGHALVYPADDELGWPTCTARLAVVAVLPDHRGRGIGRALTEAALAAAHEAGHTHVETDWRITNLLASRTWPAMGFRPAFHRLWRVVGTG